MDFSKILQVEDTPEYAKAIAAQLAAYPYLFDLIVVVLAYLIAAGFSFLLYFLLHRLMLRFYRKRCDLSPELLSCIRRMTFAFASALPIYMTAYCVWVEGVHEWIALAVRKLHTGLLILALTLTITYCIRTLGLWYKQQRNAEQRPIDGLLKVSVGFVWAAAIIIFLSVMANKSPLYLLSGLGAAAAVLLLCFQQTILSLVASVQINANHLVEIGDWISMESEGVNGFVQEIMLHTVKICNFDKSVVYMPICKLVNNPFVNNTAMLKSGGRRIRKVFSIDQRSVRFLTMEEVETLKGFDLLKEYLENKEAEISRYNAGRSEFNTRYLTNLGTFRMYAQHYLENHPKIRRDMALMVREADSSSTGIQLEICCFCKETGGVAYSAVQSDIMEHFLAILPSFRLRVFQECSDIYQEIGNQVDMVGGAFRFDQFENPVYPESSEEE